MPARKDDNRIIIAVTGANSGVGLGYCHRILRQLSTPPPSPPPDALQTPLTPTADPTSLSPSHPYYNAYTTSPIPSSSSSSTPPPTLTLILACRSRSKAEVAIKSLKKEHELGLIGRKMRGQKEREGWAEGLEIVFEELDVDKVGGRGGVLDFSRRIRENYPHLTTLILNAGIAAVTGLDRRKALRQFMTDPLGALTDPSYTIEEVGKKSGDGLRGGVWGVNVLSAYILAKELRSHLQKSPPSLPLPPRIIYVSSSKARPIYLPPPPSQDLQLLKGDSYGSSKYIGDVVTSRLDWEFNSAGTSEGKDEGQEESRREVRVLRLDPGVVWTNVSSSYNPIVAQWFMAAAFYIARWLGSRIHVISSDISAFGLTWLTLVPALFLDPPQPPASSAPRPSSSSSESAPLISPSPSPSPAPSKYLSECWRSGKPYIKLSRVAEWEKYGTGEEGGDAFLGECERVYEEWKEREREGGGREEVPRVVEGAKTD